MQLAKPTIYNKQATAGAKINQYGQTRTKENHKIEDSHTKKYFKDNYLLYGSEFFDIHHAPANFLPEFVSISKLSS